MRWAQATRTDVDVVALANRHYSRRRRGPRIGPPGEVIVLKLPNGQALWETHRSHYPRPTTSLRWSWINGYFRNESGERASDLIVEAVAATRYLLGDPPRDGLVTYVDPLKVRPNRRPGRVYERAGFVCIGDNAAVNMHGRPVLLLFHLPPESFPPAAAPLELTPALFAPQR